MNVKRKIPPFSLHRNHQPFRLGISLLLSCIVLHKRIGVFARLCL